MNSRKPLLLELAAETQHVTSWPILGADPLHVGYWRYELASRTMFWSDEVKAMHGFTRDALMTRERALGAYEAGERERISALLRHAIRTGQPHSIESQLRRRDGDVRDIVSTGTVERTADGRIVAIMGVVVDVTERKAAELERDRMLERATFAMEAGRVGIWDLDVRTNNILWSANTYAMYAIDPGVASLHDAWQQAMHPHDVARVSATIDAAISGTASDWVELEFRIVWPNGEIHDLRSRATVIRDARGAAVRVIGTNWDVTELHALAAQLRSEKDAVSRSEARYRALSDAIPQLVTVVDSAGSLEYVNARWTAYTAFSLDQIRAVGRERTLHPNDVAIINAYCKQIPPTEFECEVRLRRFDGVYRWHLFRSVPFDDSGGSGKWITSATDIEDRKSAEARLSRAAAELAHLAQHDSMTNLPNRTALMDRLSQAIAHAGRNAGGLLVLYLDLDRFKSVNDRLGHAVGDRVLAETALRISQSLRAGDTASRVGGDEFVLVCACADDGEEAVLLANRLLATVAQPIDIDGTAVTIGASIGMSRYPTDDVDADALIRKADAAMSAAKQFGRNTFRAFKPGMHVVLAETVAFEAEMRAAIARKEFVVYYQPMISLKTGRINGAEALVRWQHPRRGLLPPGEFIAFAEDRGLIGQIGELVLDEVCAHLKRRNTADDTAFSIAVNVSAQQFQQADFVQTLASTIASNGVDVTRLEIEITESLLMGNTSATIGVLHGLKALGVNLSLDDFGTGFSSLAYIKNFPIDTLKIDRSFVRDVATDRTDQALAKTIITLAHSLGMRVIGEGVETAAQIDVLRRFGCDSCQGYLISHPLPEADFARFSAAYRPLVDVDDAKPKRTRSSLDERR